VLPIVSLNKTFKKLISTLVFAGFYMWYSTSKKMPTQSILGFEVWLQQKQGTAKLLGSLLLAIACGLSMAFLGIGAGIFTFSIVLMTIASLAILLVPLGLLNYSTLCIALVFSVLLEMNI
jgi:hypothetical protein